jgi:DHA2 family multidrug resistance protein
MSSTTADAVSGAEAPAPAPAPVAPPRPVAHPPLTGSQLVLGTIALSLATFMNVLDTSIATWA